MHVRRQQIIKVAALLLALCGGERAQPAFVAPDSSFSIVFPHGWTVEDGLLKSVLVKAMMRDGTDTATIMVSVAQDRIGITSYSPNDLYSLVDSQLADVNHEFMGAGYDQRGIGSAKWIAYTIDAGPPMPNRAVYCYLVPCNSSVFTVTATVHPRNYSRYLPVFLAAARSLRVRDELRSTVTASRSNQRYVDDKYGFSLIVPDGWTSKPGLGDDVVFKLVRRSPSGGSSIMVTAVLLSKEYAEYVPDTATVRQLLNQHPFRSKMTSFTVNSVISSELGGKPAVKAEYVCTYRDADGSDRRLRSLDYYVVHRQHLMVFGIGLGNNEDEEVFESLVRSVEFTNGTREQGDGAQGSLRLTRISQGDRPLTALAKSLFSHFLRNILIIIGIGALSSVWAILRHRRSKRKDASDAPTNQV